MTLVYVTAARQGTARKIASGLLDDGVPEGCIHVYSSRRQEMPQMPVRVHRYRSPTVSLIVGAVVGAAIGALIGLPVLGLGSVGVAPLLVLMVVGGAGGAIFRLWIGNGPGGGLYRLDEALKRGETVLMIEVNDEQTGEVERKVKSRHPDVSVLGTDPQAAPPFP